MVFSSIFFIFLFLPLFLSGYFIIRKKYRNAFILLASLLFYFWGEGNYVLVMMMYMVFNYIFGILIENYKTSTLPKGALYAKITLISGLVFNLGFLVYFKYFNFIVTNVNSLLEKISTIQFNNPEVHLPIGISFFTFQALSYIIDIYRRDVVAQKNFINFSMYKALFPQLIAGPIVRYKDVSDQVTNRTITFDNFSIGIQRFIIGLAKKVFIANSVGSIADSIFSSPETSLSFGVVWLGVICYSIQLFYDFSGYSDMAIGLGKMIGFDFLENFNYPYISKSIREFWRRWHISLSSWFRDYLYIPLGGNRHGKLRSYFNLFFVFLLCGLWHGASWLFIVWGCWHGIFLVLERTPFGAFLEKQHVFFQHSYALIIITIGWVFFRADKLTHALLLIKNMFGIYGFHGTHLIEFVQLKAMIMLTLGIVLATPLVNNLAAKIKNPSWFSGSVIQKIYYEAFNVSLILLFILCVISISSGTYNPFIYFRF